MSRINRFGRACDAEQSLLLGVGFHQIDLLLRTIGQAQIFERRFVDGEDADGRAVFRRHVGDGGAIGQTQRVQPVAVELDELAHDAFLAQHLRDGEDQVSRRRAFGQLAGHLETDDLRQQHGGGLTQHARLGFNAADAPADHAQPVDHGGVRIGADHGIGIGGAIHGHDYRREVFEIHLMHDAGIGRHGAEILKRRLAPAQERIALLIALKFQQSVQLKRVVGAVVIDLHRVIDDQIDGDQRVGLLGIGSHFLERVAHRGEIDDAGHAGEILQDHAGGPEIDLCRRGCGIPLCDVFDVGALDGGAIFKAQ